VLGTEKIVDNGPSSSRWDLVVMGDGYLADEILKYQQDVAGGGRSDPPHAPFDVLRAAINVHRVNVASAETGAGDFVGQFSGQHSLSSFCSNRIERLLVCDTSDSLNVALEAVPQMNAALVVS